MTASLTFYGGINEIGGNKILLKTDDGTVLLDFGRRMNEYSKYFSDYLQTASLQLTCRHNSAHCSLTCSITESAKNCFVCFSN